MRLLTRSESLPLFFLLPFNAGTNVSFGSTIPYLSAFHERL